MEAAADLRGFGNPPVTCSPGRQDHTTESRRVPESAEGAAIVVRGSLKVHFTPQRNAVFVFLLALRLRVVPLGSPRPAYGDRESVATGVSRCRGLRPRLW